MRWETAERGPDGDWVVQLVPGAQATKAYRCPGCQQQVTAGTPHVVSWPAARVDLRRHWHSPCWRHRHRRRPR